MSRSTFFACFTELIGQQPGRYLARWRMHVAARRLVDADVTIGEVAASVGYATEAAFSRAFKRIIGEPPGSYRRGRSG